ncbi:jg25630, partial [Pararge aegeria aegeria]
MNFTPVASKPKSLVDVPESVNESLPNIAKQYRVLRIHKVLTLSGDSLA